jgi:hypothetical protein
LLIILDYVYIVYVCGPKNSLKVVKMIDIKGFEKKAVDKFYYSWTPGKVPDEKTNLGVKTFSMMVKEASVLSPEWDSIIVSRISTHFDDNKIIITSPEMFTHISHTPFFRPIDGVRQEPGLSTEHILEGSLSPSNVEIWVNFFWMPNVVSSFDNMETCDNRIDFVFEW